MWSEEAGVRGRAFQAHASVRAEAPRWELTIPVQETEQQPKGAGAGNEVGQARRGIRLAFRLRVMAALSPV